MKEDDGSGGGGPLPAAAPEPAEPPPTEALAAMALEPASVADEEDHRDHHDHGDGDDGLGLDLDPGQRKHFLVLSNAGKPVFTRHGDEQRLAPLMGMAQAILSLSLSSAADGDCVRSIATRRRKFVFLARGELYLLAVARTGEPEPFLKLQLEYLYQQIVLLLTGRRIERCFAANPSYDLRELLGGTQGVLSSILDMASDPSKEATGCILTGAVSTVPLDPALREAMARTLAGLCRPGGGGGGSSNTGGEQQQSSSSAAAAAAASSSVGRMLYAILLVGRRLAALVQPREGYLHLRGSDLLLLINFVAATPSFRGAESWTPLCLPRFNDTGFLYAYVGFLDPAAEIALVLVSANDDPEQFKTCCQCRAQVEAAFRERRWLPALAEAAGEDRRARTLNRYSNAAMAFHFLYKHCPPPPSSSSSDDATSTAAGASSASGGGSGSGGLLTLPQCVASSFFFPYIDDAAKQSVWNKYARSLLQLRYGGRSKWVHAGDATDRVLPSRRNSTGNPAETGRLSMSTSGGGGGGSEGNPKRAAACVMDVFEAPAEHSLAYEVRETDCLVVNVGPDFELYALMSAAPDLQETIQSLNRLVRAVKRDERFLFQVGAVYW